MRRVLAMAASVVALLAAAAPDAFAQSAWGSATPGVSFRDAKRDADNNNTYTPRTASYNGKTFCVANLAQLTGRGEAVPGIVVLQKADSGQEYAFVMPASAIQRDADPHGIEYRINMGRDYRSYTNAFAQNQSFADVYGTQLYGLKQHPDRIQDLGTNFGRNIGRMADRDAGPVTDAMNRFYERANTNAVPSVMPVSRSGTRVNFGPATPMSAEEAFYLFLSTRPSVMNFCDSRAPQPGR